LQALTSGVRSGAVCHQSAVADLELGVKQQVVDVNGAGIEVFLTA